MEVNRVNYRLKEVVKLLIDDRLDEEGDLDWVGLDSRTRKRLGLGNGCSKKKKPSKPGRVERLHALRRLGLS